MDTKIYNTCGLSAQSLILGQCDQCHFRSTTPKGICWACDKFGRGADMTWMMADVIDNNGFIVDNQRTAYLVHRECLPHAREKAQEQSEDLRRRQIEPAPSLIDIIVELQQRVEKLESAPVYPVPYYPLPAILPGVYPPATYSPHIQSGWEVICTIGPKGKE